MFKNGFFPRRVVAYEKLGIDFSFYKQIVVTIHCIKYCYSDIFTPLPKYFYHRRRKNGKKPRKNRKRGRMDSEADLDYGNGWADNHEWGNGVNNYDGDESSSSFHRETSNKYQLNLGINEI